jgi:mannose/fructose/N-acetylgalactosamine-specific phosphotransferase system component IIC
LTLLLSVLGGVLALDATSVGQFMISRPLVAGALTGWLLGDPVTGLEVGAMLELFHLAGMPAGGSRVPETGPASVAAVTVVVSLGSGAGLALGIALGLIVSDLGGVTVGVQRHLNGRVIERCDAGSPRAIGLDFAHASLIVLDFARGTAVTGLAIWGGHLLAQGFDSWWTLGYGTTVGIVLLGASIHLGALLKTFGGWRSRRILFMAGAVAGMIGVYLA